MKTLLVVSLFWFVSATGKRGEAEFTAVKDEDVVVINKHLNQGDNVASMADIDDFTSLTGDTNEEKVALSKLAIELLPSMIASGDVPAAGNVASFPGETPSYAKPVPANLTINGDYEGYPQGFSFANPMKSLIISTGRYAPPGAIIKVTVNQDLVDMIGIRRKISVQIGCHTDKLNRLNDLKRSPEIVFSFEITSTETYAANPWGGLVYITVPWGSKYGRMKVTVEGGIEAPYFVLGKSSVDEWKASIRDRPAPWGELELPGQITFTLPSKTLKTMNNPDEFLNEYKKMFEVVNYLAGFENGHRNRAERFVLDIQISSGWMHSGYPIMGYISHAEDMIDLDRIRDGRIWGELLEIGHNHQYASWTIFRTLAASNKIWPQYVNWKVYGSWGKQGSQNFLDIEISDYILRGKPFDSDYKANLAFQSYILFLNEVGWEKWPELMKRYYALPLIKTTDNDKLSTFVKLWCELLNTNVASYWSWWGYPLTSETLDSCKMYPDMTNNLLERYEGADYHKITDHTSCPDGWLPFGNSCFYFLKDKATWNEANDRCLEAGKTSHLASCLSSEEAFWLKNLTSTKGSEVYFVGIDTLNNDGKPRFLDGSFTSNKVMPWIKNNPVTDPLYQCAAYTKGGLTSVRCHEKQMSICKSGLTSCGASWSCPNGWWRRHDACYWVNFGGHTYDYAAQDCKDKESVLLEIDSAEENDWIVTLEKDLINFGQEKWRSYWLGVNTTTGLWNSGVEINFQDGYCEGSEAGDEGEGAKVVMRAGEFCWIEVNGSKSYKMSYFCKKDAIIISE